MKHGAERENVADRLGVAALELLRRHVLQSAEDQSLAGERLDNGRSRGVRRGRHVETGALCQPEVEELGALPREHDVARLQITMHDPTAMRLVERIGHLDGDPQRLGAREPAALEPLGQGFAFEQLHDQKEDTPLVADVVERADVWMGKTRDRLRLALEALAHLVVLGKLARQHLHCDVAVETSVASTIDLSHSASSQGGENLVRPESSTAFH